MCEEATYKAPKAEEDQVIEREDEEEVKFAEGKEDQKKSNETGRKEEEEETTYKEPKAEEDQGKNNLVKEIILQILEGILRERCEEDWKVGEDEEDPKLAGKTTSSLVSATKE